jgi:putative methionine-R-sulfoxide reductase with GAF domain
VNADLVSAIEAIAAAGGEVDDVLRATVSRLAEESDVSWAGIRFVEGDELVLGPSAGSEVEHGPSAATVIEYRGAQVGELVVQGAIDRVVLERVATLVAPYVLLGWDTGGEAWVP